MLEYVYWNHRLKDKYNNFRTEFSVVILKKLKASDFLKPNT